MNNKKETLIDFPCHFPIKIMGINDTDFLNSITLSIQQVTPEFKESSLKSRLSGKGNFIAATAEVYVNNQEQLDNIYRALTSNALVKVVL